MNALAALAGLFFQHLVHTPPRLLPQVDPRAWRRRFGARRARGALVPTARAEKLCGSFAGKTVRHRLTGQVRSLAVSDVGVGFAQDGHMPRFFHRSFRSAAKWLRHAEVVA